MIMGRIYAAISKNYSTLVTIEIIEKRYIYLISKVLNYWYRSDKNGEWRAMLRKMEEKKRGGRIRKEEEGEKEERGDDERLFAKHFLWNSASRRMGLFTSTFLNEESCLPASQLRVFLKKKIWWMKSKKRLSLAFSIFCLFLFLFLNQNIPDLCLCHPESRINEKKRKDIYGLFSLPAPTKSKRCPFVLSQFFFFFLNQNNIHSCLTSVFIILNREENEKNINKKFSLLIRIHKIKDISFLLFFF